ncbi:MAG: HAD family phosphatase [Spirochaetales bacterium]|nr:HAD family phosphatase [Spirochaetales bacterium]
MKPRAMEASLQPRSSGSRISLYVFDMGGVVSLDCGYERKVADSLGMPVHELYALTDAEFQELTAGRICLDEFWARVSRKTGKPIHEDLFEVHFHPQLDHRVVRLVERLRQEARVVVGTNTVETHYRVHQREGHYRLFDAVYASCRMGLAKPDPRFFRHILEREERRPEESVFVDDRAENVQAAAKLGMAAIQFTDASSLERAMAQMAGGKNAISG